MDYQKRRLTWWPSKLVGPPPGLKEVNLICWCLFVACVIAPSLIVLIIQLKTGALFYRQNSVDFIYLYGTGRIANENPAVKVYDYDLQLKTFNAILPLREGFYGLSPYPPFVSQFFRLFALLTFEQAYFLWMGISLSLYILSIVATLKEFLPEERLKRSLILCFALAAYPFLMNTLANGQLSTVAVASVCLAVSQEKRKNPFRSGLALAMLAYKPTLLLLLPMLLLTRRFKAFWGFVTGACLLIAVATGLAGIQIWSVYARFLVTFGHASGLNGHSSLRLWKYVDFNSLSYAIPGGRSAPALAILGCFIVVVAAWLATLWWKSASGGGPEQNLAWAVTLSWTMLLNVYYPIYDSILLTVGIILTLSALRELEWDYARDWIVLLAVLTFAISWVTEAVARQHGIQPLTLAVLTIGLVQTLILQRAIRRRSALRSTELLTI